MKNNKGKRNFSNKNRKVRNKVKEENDSEIESDDILSSVESENDRKIIPKKKQKKITNSRNGNNSITEEESDESDKIVSDEENEDAGSYMDPEERKIFLAKKYIKSLGVELSDHSESETYDTHWKKQDKKSATLSDEENDDDESIFEDENDEKKKQVTKWLQEQEKLKSPKLIMYIGNKIKIGYNKKLSYGENNKNKKEDQIESTHNEHTIPMMDKSVIFYRGHLKSVTCVDSPSYDLSFLSQYDFTNQKQKNSTNADKKNTLTNNKWNHTENGNLEKNEENEEDNEDNDTDSDNSDDSEKEELIEPKIFPNTNHKIAYTGGKDGCIIEWDIERGEKVHIYKGNKQSFTKYGEKPIAHFKSVMDLHCHKYNSFFISVGSDNLINVWDSRDKRNCTNSIIGHTHMVTSVSGCDTTEYHIHEDHNFFTASYDKSIKLWDLRFFNKPINTFYGHTDSILQMNSISKNKLVTGSSDNTLRVWNTSKDNHMIFNLKYETIESCCTLNNHIFIAGTFSGHLYVFSQSYKKPIAEIKNAHSKNPVTALISIPFTNIVISGSFDGFIHFWEYKPINKITCTFTKITSVQVQGVVNKFSFSCNYKYLFVAIGNEMKHGTWTRVKSKSGIAVIPLEFLR